MRNKYHHELLRHAFVHTVIDDHSRVAYTEIQDNEQAATAIAAQHCAVSWFADHGVTVERVLSDNGPACRSHAWRHACSDLGARRPTARSNDSSTRSPTAGPTHASTDPNQRAEQHFPPGFTSTINTGPTPVPPITRLNDVPGL